MERSMFELIPTSRGWCLDGGEHRGRRPTGVWMPVEDERVLLARCG